jgi:hypothetical protein
VVIKSSLILAMLLGLVSYARSQNSSESHGFSLAVCKSILTKAGYVEVEQTHRSRGLTVDNYELRTPSRPHFHLVWQIELTSRDDDVVNVIHYGSDGTEFPD